MFEQPLIPGGFHSPPAREGYPQGDMRECTLKLARKTVIVESASGVKRAIDLRTLRLLREAGAVARMIQRKRDKAITRVFLLAEPDEIGKRITAQAEVVKVGASTWWHTRNMGMLGEKAGA